MIEFLYDPLELSILEEAEEEIFMEDYNGNLETYEDEELNDYLARRSSHLDEDYDEYEEADFEYPAISSEEEDTWWALTDGMYGDCPTNPIAYDAAMEAMGF